MTITPVILSGGSGTRLWPLSTKETPKQFLSLTSEKTMIQQTLLRLNGLKTSAPIISCNEGHRFLVAQQIGEISNLQPVILLEPVAKNTAPAIAAACLASLKQDKDAIVVVLPSDHVIKDEQAFRDAVLTAAKQAEKGKLVTFGIVPTFAATGYGYVKASGDENDGAYTLERFVEKPDLPHAQEYLASGQYSWNSGMFVFKASSFLEELEKYEPKMAELTRQSFEKAKVDADFIRLDKDSFDKIDGNSIDYAVMEKTSNGMIVKLDAGWDDVGSWSALYDIQPKDINGNVTSGKVVTIDTKNSYVRAKSHTIATIGVNNIVVVESDDSILIADKDHVQDVKKAAGLVSEL